MNNKPKIAIIIPCYNEANNILNLYNEIRDLSSLCNYSLEPVFINDCSTDNTKLLLEEYELIHLNLAVNLGIGGAVQSGLSTR